MEHCALCGHNYNYGISITYHLMLHQHHLLFALIDKYRERIEQDLPIDGGDLTQDFSAFYFEMKKIEEESKRTHGK